ncbi:VTT domain-containing protein [Candidatus Micrarchaeota archaeon]|nr:VTT domain-containing protein [Candidatus Micrarchaeota archaeon]
MFFNVEQLILSFGYASLFLILFAETGLLVGFFLPGDTLLFTAGLLASKNIIGLGETIAVCALAAVVGDSFGYFLGKRFGKRVFEKEGHFLDDYLNKKNLERTKRFFEKHGGKTIFFARWIPVVRTIAPTFAGTGEMSYLSFLFYNVLGGVSWVLSVTLAGYFLGSLIPNLVEYVSIAILLVVVISFVPVLVRLARGKR